MKLIIGLGNPGEQYINTRHNLGFVALDDFRRKSGLGQWEANSKLKAEIIKTPDLILARPQTYMNKSGMAVRLLANFFKVSPQDIIVIHDELDLTVGHIKIRQGGAAAGHHGVESIINGLKSDQFIRIRLGIGTGEAFSGERKQINFNAEHFVLEEFTQKERSKVKAMLKRSLTALELILEKGLDKAQNQFN